MADVQLNNAQQIGNYKVIQSTPDENNHIITVYDNNDKFLFSMNSISEWEEGEINGDFLEKQANEASELAQMNTDIDELTFSEEKQEVSVSNNQESIPPEDQTPSYVPIPGVDEVPQEEKGFFESVVDSAKNMFNDLFGGATE